MRPSRYFSKLREMHEATDNQWSLAWCEVTMADLDWCRGRHEQAKARLASATERMIACDDPGLMCFGVHSLSLAIGTSDPLACATGLGCAHAAEQQLDASNWETIPGMAEEVIRKVRQMLGEPTWGDAYSTGMQIDLVDHAPTTAGSRH